MTKRLFKKESKIDIKRILTDYAMFIVVLVMILFTGFTRSNFLTVNNFTNILSNTSVRFIIALGVSGTLIIRGTDLSAGRIVGFSAIMAGSLLQKPDFVGKFFPNLPDLPMIVPLIAVIVICALFGLMNGIIVAKLHVPPFLATLGTQIMIYGINMLYSKNTPIGTFKDSYINIGQGKILGVPYLVIIAAIVGFGMWVLYNHTKHGKYMYAIGGNEQAAEVSGVNVAASKIKIFMLAGALYGLAGFLLSAKTGSVGSASGTGYELEAIAAATIGGVSTAGGQGTVPGILLGVFVFELLKTCLAFLGVKPEMTNVIQGIVIVIAVALDIRKSMRKK